MPRTKKVVVKAKKEEVTEVKTTPAAFNFMNLLLIVVALFSLYLFYKIHTLEQKIAGSTVTAAAGQPAEATPLSVDNLKKYAKDLGLDTGKFNSCLDSGSKAKAVAADENYGQSLGVQGTPGFFVNGRFIGGAFPFSVFKEIIDKEIAGTGSTTCSDYPSDMQQYCQPNGGIDLTQKTVDVNNAPGEGANNPKVTIVEFADFQCPYCVRAYPTTEQILKTYGNDVKFYYKQFPLSQIHPYAEKAAEASMCALDQGKFWQYHDKLFGVQQGQ